MSPTILYIYLPPLQFSIYCQQVYFKLCCQGSYWCHFFWWCKPTLLILCQQMPAIKHNVNQALMMAVCVVSTLSIAACRRASLWLFHLLLCFLDWSVLSCWAERPDEAYTSSVFLFCLPTLEPGESNFHALLSPSNPTSLHSHWACRAAPSGSERGASLSLSFPFGCL